MYTFKIEFCLIDRGGLNYHFIIIIITLKYKLYGYLSYNKALHPYEGFNIVAQMC